MALPPGVTPKVVTVGIASFFDGSLANGTASITAPVNVIHTPTNRPIFSSIITAPFVDGAASFTLAPTDDPGLNRVDWTYKLNVNIAGALVQPDPVYFTLPAAGPDAVDLDSLVTVPSSAGMPISVAAALLAGPNTFTGTQDFTRATVLGVGGAVSSVVGQAGAVTGTQIAADPALRNAYVSYLPAPSGDATGAADVAAINSALTAAATAGGGRVLAKPGVTYQVAASGTTTVLHPSGSTASRSICVQIPSGVTLDMNGSTLQLRGTAEAIIVGPQHLDNTVRDHDLGLINAVIDARSITYTSHAILHFAHLDRLQLRTVKIINGMYQGGWIYNVADGRFDLLDADTIQGQAWTFGDPQATGAGTNQVYDSWFGTLRGKNLTLLDTGSHPGNPYNLVLTRCTIDSISVRNCSAGIKLQQPSTDVVLGLVEIDTCGEATALNSGFKLQGDPTYPAGTDRPTRIRVGQVIATNQANIGLYLYHTQDCHVASYAGYNNVLLHTANSDVLLAGGVNDYVGVISSRNSHGGGVRISNDSASAGPTGYRLPNVRVTDPGQNASNAIKSGFRVDVASSGTIGELILVDDQGTHTMDKGVDVTVTTATGSIASMSISGQTGTAFNSSSAGFTAPSTTKNNYTATSDPLVTSDSGAGYGVGSTWVNTTSKVAFECLDATAGAAVWRRLVADVQVFSSSGTWTKPTWATSAQVSLLGSGGGGGAGARGAANTARVGGGGGGGGALADRMFQTADLTATVAVTIGAVGSGAAAVSVDDTAGGNGTAAGSSQFASYLRASGGSGGTGGGLAGAGGGAGAGGTGPIAGASGGAANTGGGVGSTGASASAGSGGGSGGGISSGNTATNGGAGSPMLTNGGSPGAAGVAPGGAGGAGGASPAASSTTPGGGGGGGAGSITGAAGNGGAGGNFGAGGGGGGASLDGNASGAGGSGAPGICVVICR